MTTILLIEDDPHSARLTTRVLQREGYDIVHASEGLTGLKIASQQKVDLILLDLGLPDIGGHTIAALINRIPGDIPVVAVSASTDSMTRNRAMAYGCDGYITKPIDTRAFAEQIGPFLKNGEAGEEAPAGDGDRPSTAL